LHELLSREEGGAAQAEAVGGASANVYAADFPDYVRNRLDHLKGPLSSLLRRSDGAYQDFYRTIEPLIEKKRFVAFLRNLLARPLEIAILLDRALFVEEIVDGQNLNVQLIQLFDPRISSRNAALVASFVS
jgi:hypothetical protein